MPNPKDITLLLTLKGRPLHTLRWMWHAERTKLPFKVIIADGGDDQGIIDVLSRPELFPSVDYVYRRYNDVDIRAFWFKLVDSLNQVDTPYVMMVDNDDFVVPSGMLRLAQDLDENPDYVCAGANTPSFAIDDKSSRFINVTGPMRIISDFPMDGADDYTIQDAMERVRQQFKRPLTLYYSLYRVEILRQLRQYVLDHDLRNFDIIDKFKSIHTAALGPFSFRSETMNYIRQVGTSSLHGVLLKYDSDHRFYYWGWIDDLKSNVSHVVSLLSGRVKENPDQIQAEIDALALAMLRLAMTPREMRTESYDGLYYRLRKILAKSSFLVRLHYARNRKRLIQRFLDKGASPQMIESLDADLSAIEETLSGDGFLDFVQSVAPVYAAPAS